MDNDNYNQIKNWINSFWANRSRSLHNHPVTIFVYRGELIRPHAIYCKKLLGWLEKTDVEYDVVFNEKQLTVKFLDPDAAYADYIILSAHW